MNGMKKILLALNPANPDREAIDFACYLSKLARTKVTGVFLVNQHEWPLQVPLNVLAGKVQTVPDEVKSTVMKQALYHFKESCICRDAAYLLHKENAITADQLIEESRFSDVMILPAGLSPGSGTQAAPSPLSRYILTGVNCPAILTPGAFERIDQIVFTYNGSKAAVFAIRQFTYLFPEFRNTPATVLAVNTDKNTLADQPALMDWLGCHYRNVEYKYTYGDTADELINYLMPRRDALVVMGAYGRNALFRMLKRSMADPVSETLFNPLFIAHS
jgi:hypothetical protein